MTFLLWEKRRSAEARTVSRCNSCLRAEEEIARAVLSLCAARTARWAASVAHQPISRLSSEISTGPRGMNKRCGTSHFPPLTLVVTLVSSPPSAHWILLYLIASNSLSRGSPRLPLLLNLCSPPLAYRELVPCLHLPPQEEDILRPNPHALSLRQHLQPMSALYPILLYSLDPSISIQRYNARKMRVS